MVVVYDAMLTEPPSSVYCFRDVTLYVNVFLDQINLISCPKGTRSMYWKWIKRYGAHDFIDELLTEEEQEDGLYVGLKKTINYKLINEYNYTNLIQEIKVKL